MKMHFLGLTAFVCALAFNAFTKPFATQVHKLLHKPDISGVVNNPAEWSTAGFTFGQCFTVQNDLACSISIDNSRSSYFHTDWSGTVLNTFAYADAQSPKQDYLEITETLSGVGFYRIISSITPKTYDIPTNTYVSVSLGSDLSFKNRKNEYNSLTYLDLKIAIHWTICMIKARFSA